MQRSSRSRRASRPHWLPALAALAVGAVGAFALPTQNATFGPVAVGVAALVGLGAELAAWWRPARPPVLRLRYSAWVLPALLTLAAMLALRLPLDGRAVPWLIQLLYLALLAVVLLLQDVEAARGAEGGVLARFGLTLVAYAVAFVLFTLLALSRAAAPPSALAAGAITGLLAVVQLRQHGTPAVRHRTYAAALALTLAQAAAGASFWSVPALVEGALLLLLFYVLAGMAEALLDDALDRRVLLEYGIVAAFGAALILSTTPWRG